MAKPKRYVIKYWPLNSKGKVTSHTMQTVETNSQKTVAFWDEKLREEGHRIVGIEDRHLN